MESVFCNSGIESIYNFYNCFSYACKLDSRAILINVSDIVALYGENYVDLMCELVNERYNNGDLQVANELKRLELFL